MASAEENQCQSQHYYVGADIDNRYKLTEFIGAGGMACVYRAKETNTPHDFALKFLKSEYHNMEYLVKYFEDEASSMRDLAHPNIVRFYRFENKADYSYIVMDYVDGFALSGVLKLSRKQNKSMPLDEVVRVMVQVARALDAIHRDDFVHRDIKPSNVLIDRRSGQAFLTDLGITSATGVKIEGAGTIAYMSPEQSETWTADHRSDIYAYGILIYEMLAGQRPFNVQPGLRGSEAEVDLKRKHKESPVPDITRIRSDLPSALNGILAKSMAKDPDDRYQSVIEFARDVHRALTPKLSADLQDFSSVQHRRIAAPDAPLPDTTSNRLITLGIATLVIASLIIVGIFLSGGLNTPDPTETPSPTPRPTDTLLELIESEFTYLEGAGAFSEPDVSESAASGTIPVVKDTEENFNFLRIDAVNGFRVEMDINNAENAGAYGIAFRMVDVANYHLFVLDTVAEGLRWRILRVQNNTPGEAQTGMLESAATQITVAGIDNYFEISVDGQLLTRYTSPLFPTGSLAVYLDNGELDLNNIQVLLPGDGSEARPETYGLGHPLRHIRRTYEAILGTLNMSEISVDCGAFNPLYDELASYENDRDALVRSYASTLESTADTLRRRCDTQPGIFDVTGDIQDLLSVNTLVNNNLETMRSEMGDEESGE